MYVFPCIHCYKAYIRHVNISVKIKYLHLFLFRQGITQDNPTSPFIFNLVMKDTIKYLDNKKEYRFRIYNMNTVCCTNDAVLIQEIQHVLHASSSNTISRD